MVNKVKTWFTDTVDKIRTSVKIDLSAPFYYLALLVIFILAMLVRMSPVVQGTFLIKAFDPWYQYDSVKKLIDVGWYEWVNLKDYQFWYPEGVTRSNLRPGLLVTNALLYKFLIALGIEVTVFQVVFYFPVLMGGLTVLVVFFLGKEILDKRAGLFAAFFLAFSPGHMQRTVAGFFDNETIGIFAILLEFLFFIRATKKGKLSDGIFAGLSLGYLALSWGGLTFGYLIIPLIVGILILADKYDGRVFMAYTATIGVGVLINTLSPAFNWQKDLTSMEIGVNLLFLVFLIAYHFIYMQKGTSKYEQILTAIKWSLIPLAAVAAILLWIDPAWMPFNLGSRLQSIINPNIREEINLVASVGEHSPSPWSVFYYNSMIPVLLVIPGVYFALRRSNVEDILMIVFAISLFYFTGSMIRIVLLFAPAMAILGGYALSNILKFFGNLMKDKPAITRRRKRQLSHTLGKSEGVIVYILIGILLFVQANQAIDMSVNQLGYSELISAGVFHDWEESFTWMDSNLDSSTVVVSWWDYGYWLTTIGNVTTVNDNGTWNQTRIGLTGMAMMQTDEQMSAEVFRALDADYVMVYFGHLLSGLGGDEGKWPWMLRICNDNTANYETMGNIPKDNWYEGGVDTVFNEDYYVNETSGAYFPNWFDTTLVKLMFAEEIVTSAGLSDNSPYTSQYLASSLEGTSEAPGRTDTYGNSWLDYDTVNGNYELQYFTPTYFSLNRMVKIFKVDYDALDSDFEIDDTYIDTNGLGYATVNNTGTSNLILQDLLVSDNVNDYAVNYTLEDENVPIAPGESRYVWFDSTEIDREQFNLGDGYTIKMQMGLADSYTGYKFYGESISSTVKEPESTSIGIDKSTSYIEYKNGQYNAHLTLQNLGLVPVKINDLEIANQYYNQSETSALLGRELMLAPDSSEEIELTNLDLSLGTDFTEDALVSIHTVLGPSVQSIVSQSTKGYAIDLTPTILGDLPEAMYRFDQNTYELVDTTPSEIYVNHNTESYLLDNGTLHLKIENTGEEMFALQNVVAADSLISDYEIMDELGTYVDPTVGDNYQLLFVDPGETRSIRAIVPDVELNIPKLIGVTASIDGDTISRKSAYFVPRSATEKVSIVNETHAQSFVFTDEVVRLTLKNICFDSITLDEVVLNGTETISLNSSMVLNGSLTLAPDEIAIVEFDITSFAVNLTNSLDVQINLVGVPTGFNTATLDTLLPSLDEVFRINLPGIGDDYSHQEYDTYADLSREWINVVIEVENEQLLTIDSVMFSLTGDDDDYQYLDLSSGDVELLNVVGFDLVGDEADDTTIALYDLEINANALGITLTLDEPVYIKIRTTAGYEATVSITVIP
ncbi:MAG: STT3 domain-containing protein [Promethearchaeota archaeon]